LLASVLLFCTCKGPVKQKPSVDKSQFLALTIDVEVSNKNSLLILLAKDGTINRARSGIVDTTDKNFFMGVTTEKLFDSVMATVPDDLFSYCNQPSTACDTTKQTCVVKYSFSGETSGMECGYCVNGSLENLPKPILEYIKNAIRITDPWYQSQKNNLKTR